VNRLIHYTQLSLAVCATLGCGTTRWTDTQRTATEQLLISDAIDRAVQDIDVRVLAGKEVYIDSKYLGNVVDKDYLVSSLRQHLLASGCKLKDKHEDAAYILEPRSGALGTDRNDLLYGVPALTRPTFGATPWSIPSSLPEIPLVKRTDQQGVAKIAVFAYHRETGKPLWQSGVARKSSRTKDTWFLGAGPFRKGTIHDGTIFAGQKLSNPLVKRTPKVDEEETAGVDITSEARFDVPGPTVADRVPFQGPVLAPPNGSPAMTSAATARGPSTAAPAGVNAANGPR
jgi:hypothetical protein